MDLKVEVLEHIHQVQLSNADKMISIFKVEKKSWRVTKIITAPILIIIRFWKQQSNL